MRDKNPVQNDQPSSGLSGGRSYFQGGHIFETVWYETLRRQMAGVVPVDCKPGPSTVLTQEEEGTLAKYCADIRQTWSMT